MRKAVVTQALAFTGYALCRRLLEEGVEVAAIDRIDGDEQKENKLGYLVRNALFEFHDGTLGDRKIEEAFSGAEVCYYFGNGGLSGNLHISLSDTIDTVRSFLNAAEEASFIVHASSTDVYREVSGKIDEGNEILPISEKGMIAVVEESLFTQISNPYAILRFPEIYGPFQPPEGKVCQLLDGCKPEKPPADILYIDDAVEALFMAANSKVRGIYNAASGKGNQWNTCRMYVESGVRSEPSEMERSHPSLIYSIEKAQKSFGFSPKTTIQDGVDRQKLSKKAE